MSLLDDHPRAIEEALRSMFPRDYDAWTTIDCKAWHADYRVALNAALAALPREELIEQAAEALCGPPYPPPLSRSADVAEAMLVAIGLIPEHVTPEEKPKP